MKNIFFLLVCFHPAFSFAQSDLFKPQNELIGTTISELKITDYLLNEPANKNFDGKFKVLEFWATWCKPCLKAVPHLNKLQRKFQDSNIVFLSITYEKPEQTEKVFSKVKFETIVVSDQTRTVHQALRVQYKGTMPLPRTVLMDDQNKIVWYGSPADLSEKMIERFLRKEKLTDK
ncbi:MAG TPA: TlpA disulfide reductase family protein [Flavisolibacter sp.]|jgi:thiol-disulfide isomerase/thioredoxin